jgi:hypothetical protein
MFMPDHLHLFVKGDANFMLSRWMGGLKRTIAVALGCPSRKLWQPGFLIMSSLGRELPGKMELREGKPGPSGTGPAGGRLALSG